MKNQNRDSQDIVNHLRDKCPKLQGLLYAREDSDYWARFVDRIDCAATQLMHGILAETA
jgi:hypothetical protein